MDSPNLDLLFNVAQLLKEHIGATRILDFRTPALVLSEGGDAEGEGPLVAHDVEGSVKVTRMSRDLLVQGMVGAQVMLTCSRCLEEFLLPVDAKLEEEYRPTVDVETGRPVARLPEEANEETFDMDPNHQLDLTEPVRQALLVALPMKPLHSEDCKGLCSVCGANLNEIDCGHKFEQTDERWSGLRELRVEDFPPGDGGQNN